jgi:uncharacterized membrane protein YdbT with pleckstrin-like domain
MSDYVKRAMQPNEKIRYQAQLHWIIYETGIFFTLLGILFAVAGNKLVIFLLGGELAEKISVFFKYGGFLFIAIGFIQLIGSFIRQISTELVITDQRVIAKHGFIATTSYELMMSKVEGATIDQTVLGRILGYGTLYVKGTGGGISPIDHVASPFLFHSHLMTAVRAAHEGGEGNVER